MGEIAFKKIIIILLTLIFLAMSTHYLYQRQRDVRSDAELRESIGERKRTIPGEGF